MRKPSEILAVLHAAVWVCAVRIALWIMPLRRLRPLADYFGTRVMRPERAPSANHLSWAVSAASRYIPQASCLTQAIALHILLKRAGYPSRVRIGVAKEHGKFASHAWVESQDKIIIGNFELQRYTPMFVWD
jgi:hypothetical protein